MDRERPSLDAPGNGAPSETVVAVDIARRLLEGAVGLRSEHEVLARQFLRALGLSERG